MDQELSGEPRAVQEHWRPGAAPVGGRRWVWAAVSSNSWMSRTALRTTSATETEDMPLKFVPWQIFLRLILLPLTAGDSGVLWAAANP